MNLGGGGGDHKHLVCNWINRKEKFYFNKLKCFQTKFIIIYNDSLKLNAFKTDFKNESSLNDTFNDSS